MSKAEVGMEVKKGSCQIADSVIGKGVWNERDDRDQKLSPLYMNKREGERQPWNGCVETPVRLKAIDSSLLKRKHEGWAAMWVSHPRTVLPTPPGILTSVFEMGTGEPSRFGRPIFYAHRCLKAFRSASARLPLALRVVKLLYE